MKITLKNDYHNTSVNVTVSEKWGIFYKLSAEQVKRAKKELCPSDDCTCGNAAGMRGDNDYHLTFYEAGNATASSKIAI